MSAAPADVDELEAVGAVKPPPLPFDLVPVADLVHRQPPPPEFAWQGLVPIGVATLASAHGGVGKSTVFLMLGIASLQGLPLFGHGTRRTNVCYYSGEDSADTLRHRLHGLCRHMRVDPASLEGRLHVLDATAYDPRLYAEVRHREGELTAAFDALREYVKAHDIGLVILDNASDVFDANEIDRARVRAFMRALNVLAREAQAGVVLLSHVDKGTARGERIGGAEGYSGSTAWHNSARSRLFMSRTADGGITIEHQKCNLGPLSPPIALTWPAGGWPTLEAPPSGIVAYIGQEARTKCLLQLIADANDHGGTISTAESGPSCLTSTHRASALYPRHAKRAEIFECLRTAERQGLIKRERYRKPDRHYGERWEVTDAGRKAAGIPTAGGAGGAAVHASTAPDAPDAPPAGGAASAAHRGVGGPRRTLTGAEVPALADPDEEGEVF